jgi:LPS biosynthesis protein
MRELTQDELKDRAFELLKEFRDVCEKNNLRYYLTGGTLLGAVRHKGFIPWDDDIDVAMPRIDYLKFLKIYKREYDKNNLFAYEINKNYKYMFAKLCDKDTSLIEFDFDCKEKLGVYLDIFPIDGLGKNEKSLSKDKKSFLLAST